MKDVKSNKKVSSFKSAFEDEIGGSNFKSPDALTGDSNMILSQADIFAVDNIESKDFSS